MSKPPKIDRKSLKGTDSFVRGGRELVKYLAGHRARFLPVLIAALLVVIGSYGYELWSRSRLDKAWTAYHEASKAEEAKRWDALKKVNADWKSSRAGFFAAVNLADHYFEESKKATYSTEAKPAEPAKKPGDVAKPAEPAKAADPKLAADSAVQALDWYGKALKYSDLLPAEKQLLTVNRGNTFELQKKYDEALADYQKAVEMGAESRPFAMLQVARAFELKNDKARAIETYEKISADFSTTEYAKSAKALIRRLKSPIFAGEKL